MTLFIETENDIAFGAFRTDELVLVDISNE